jgi:hypothetical protein
MIQKKLLQLFDLTTKSNYLLCIGSQRKIASSEQEAAKQGLINLGLSLNY